MNTLHAREQSAIIEEICNRIADGESLSSILKDPGLPSMSTVRRWRLADQEVERSFLLASQAQADTFADMVLEVAESARGGTKEDVAAARLKIDVLRWRAGQQSPSKWGINRQQVELSGSVDLRQLSDAELLALLAEHQVKAAEILQREGMMP